MKFKKKSLYFSIICVFVIISFSYSTSVVQAVTETLTINVTIESSAQINILPASFTFEGMYPGFYGTDQSFSVKNTGSTNISAISVYTSTIEDEDSNPLGAGSATAYASTGFILIKNNTAENHSYAGRLEWNLSNILQNESLDLDPGTTRFLHGFHRNATYGDYLFKVENGTAGLCNNSGVDMKIINTPENGSQHRNFTSESTTSGSYETGNEYWGIFSFTSGPLQDHCVAADYNCTKIFIYKYDQRSNFTGCGIDSNFDTTILTPGNEINGMLYASIPQGMSLGQTIIGSLTFDAT